MPHTDTCLTLTAVLVLRERKTAEARKDAEDAATRRLDKPGDHVVAVAWLSLSVAIERRARRDVAEAHAACPPALTAEERTRLLTHRCPECAPEPEPEPEPSHDDRVRALEAEGLSTSDAQAVADAEALGSEV